MKVLRGQFCFKSQVRGPSFLVGLNVSTPNKLELNIFHKKIVHNFVNLKLEFVNLELKKQNYFVYFMYWRCTNKGKNYENIFSTNLAELGNCWQF